MHVVGSVDGGGHAVDGVADGHTATQPAAVLNVVHHERRVVQHTDHLRNRDDALVRDVW